MSKRQFAPTPLYPSIVASQEATAVALGQLVVARAHLAPVPVEGEGTGQNLGRPAETTTIENHGDRAQQEHKR